MECGIADEEDLAVVATTQICSAKCHVNMGLSCAHVLRVYIKCDAKEVSLDRILGFSVENNCEGENVGDDEEEPRENGRAFIPGDMPVNMGCDEGLEADLLGLQERWDAIKT